VGITYLVDTNIVSEMMKPRPNQNAFNKWHIEKGKTAIAAVTWHELLFGTFQLPSSRRRTSYMDFLHRQLLTTMPVLVYDQVAAEWHAQERARLTLVRRPPAFADGQIAAIAATNELILVTRNVSDFTDFSDLIVENWFD